MTPWTRTTGFTALTIGLFGFAASLTAFANPEQCARCLSDWQYCVDNADGPNQAQACDSRYRTCTSRIKCPAQGPR